MHLISVTGRRVCCTEGPEKLFKRCREFLKGEKTKSFQIKLERETIELSKSEGTDKLR